MNHIFGRPSLRASLVVLLLCQACSSIQIPGMGSAGEGGSGGNIAGRADSFQKFTAYGTMNLLSALSEVGTALGRKEEAAHYAAVADTFNQGTISEDTYKTAKPMITESKFKPEQIAVVRSAEGKKHLRDSFIYFSIGSYMDKKASAAAELLLQAKPSPVELANRTVAGAFEVAKIAKDALPTHLATAGKWISALTAYMKANHIPVPTNAEIKKVAEKQAASLDLSDFPST